MRNLTLNEKITIKGKFAQKGLNLPKLTTGDAIRFWTMCYGTPISCCFTQKKFFKTMKRGV